MPTTRKRRRRRPLPADFAAIDLSERGRWGRGDILVEGGVERVPGAVPARPLTVWPSWAVWAEVYGRCRGDFLTHYRVRHPIGMPGVERLHQAYQSGGDAGAEAAKAELRQQERENDPRLRLRETA